MSERDVYPNDMNEPHDLDAKAIDDLLAGGGHIVAPRLAELIADMRLAYTSTPPTATAELSTLMRRDQPAPASSHVPRRFERARGSMLAKIGAATAAVIATTGGLAVAHALPGPVQDAVSHLGVSARSQHKSEPPVTQDPTTTIDPTTTTVTTSGTPDNRGAVVSGVAHDHTATGCEHGAAVSKVASDVRSRPGSQNTPTTTALDQRCTKPPTTADSTSPTTTETKHANHGATTPTSQPERGTGNPGTINGGHTSPSDGGHAPQDNGDK